ncbi:MAG TPA: anti-sigma factor [Pyrinomonadaceae bacterium]|jgi:anti-sigma-K factor RskA|nr:anti-sigma factor [Pyrinomonadaceae bacterium]
MNDELMLDLLSKKASEGLDPQEQKQLDELIAVSAVEDESFEMAAAAISMIDLKTNEPLPEHLQAKILADADRIWDTPKETVRQISYTEPKASFWNWGSLGWAAAAAACIVLAINVWMTRFETPPIAEKPPIEEKLTPAQMRQRLIDSGSDVIQAKWTVGNDKTVQEISGDIVWSDAKQAGYMRFRGLPVNDASKQTYQLWIFDESQDEKTPIDGGVFDIGGGGDVIIPINAKLKASKPKMFAVTVEKPGGVVVSKRDKIAALAKVEI